MAEDGDQNGWHDGDHHLRRRHNGSDEEAGDNGGPTDGLHIIENGHRSHGEFIGEIMNDHAELRRRKSHDSHDAQENHHQHHHHHHHHHHQQQHSNGHNHHHQFQEEILKAFRHLQQQNDDEEQRSLLERPKDNNATMAAPVMAGEHNSERAFHGFQVQMTPASAQQAYGGLTPSTPASIFKALKATSIEEQMTSHPSSIVATSPLPPLLMMTPPDIRPPSSCAPSKTCNLWFISTFFFWLLSPSKLLLYARLAGITAAVLSSFFSAANYAISEYLEENFDPVEVFAWRQTLLIFYCFPVAAYYEKPMYFGRKDIKLWWPMLLRSVGSSLAILFIYEAVEYIPLSDATVVANAAPIFCSIFARIMLKEKFGLAEILCSIAVICGVTLNAQPAWLFDFSLLTTNLQKRLVGLSFALGGALATAFTTVIMRTMKQVHFSSQQLMFSYISTIITWPFVFLMGVARYPPCGLNQKLIVLAIGFTALPAQALLIYACQNEKAGVVSIARSTMPFFALFFQIACFGIIPDLYSIAGNLIIFGAIVALAVKMLRESSSPTAKKQPLPSLKGVDETNNSHNNSNVLDTSNNQDSHYVQLGGNGNDSDIFSPHTTVTSVTSAAALFSSGHHIHIHQPSDDASSSSPKPPPLVMSEKVA